MKISNKPNRVDLEIVQGATFGPCLCTMKNPDGTPVNLTGFVFRGGIRHKASDPTLLASFVFTITDALLGKYTFELTAATTATLPAGVSAEAAESVHDYDHEFVDTLGRVVPLRWGTARVHRQVPHA